MFAVFLIVNASSTSLDVWLVGLHTTVTLGQSTWCCSVQACSANGDELKSACLIAHLCSSKKVLELLDHLNSIEDSINFTVEVEEKGQLPFLDVLLTH